MAVEEGGVGFSVQTQVVFLAALNAALVTAGLAVQKVNETQKGSLYVSWMLVLAGLCFAPTFFITNVVYRIGGKMSVYNPAAAALNLVMIPVVAYIWFGEAITASQIAGMLLILIGLALVVPNN